MNHVKKFDQIWGFRKRDDDIDSSSDDSKSNTHGEESVLKKHNLVSDFILPENDDVDYTRRSHDEDLLDQDIIVSVEDKKTNGKKRGLVKTKKTVRAPRGILKKEASRKKSKLTSQLPVSDDLRIFTESVIEELRVARENMFAHMREDMRKLITSGPNTKPARKKGVRKTSQNQQKKSAAVNDKSTKAKKCKKDLEEKDNHEVHDQTNETITSDEKEKVLEEKNPMHPAQPDKAVSTSYLTGNDSRLNLERGNLLTDTNGRTSYFPSVQTDEPFRSYGQDNESFCMETGFPIPLHRRLDYRFNIPRPVLESSSRDSSNMVGLRMNGGSVRLSSGTTRALPDHFVPNNFRGFYPS